MLFCRAHGYRKNKSVENQRKESPKCATLDEVASANSLNLHLVETVLPDLVPGSAVCSGETDRTDEHLR